MLRDEGVILDVGCIPDEIAQILKNGWSSTSNSLDYDNIITTLRNLSNKEDDELETQSFDIFEDNLYYTEVSEEESLINTNYVKMRDLPTGQSIYSGWNPEKFECKLSNMTISVDGERLGEGNFGVVLRGNIIYSRNPRQNGIVAVKILKKHSDKENKVFCKEMALSEVRLFSIEYIYSQEQSYDISYSKVKFSNENLKIFIHCLKFVVKFCCLRPSS